MSGTLTSVVATIGLLGSGFQRGAKAATQVVAFRREAIIACGYRLRYRRGADAAPRRRFGRARGTDLRLQRGEAAFLGQLVVVPQAALAPSYRAQFAVPLVRVVDRKAEVRQVQRVDVVEQAVEDDVAVLNP